jgi:hypothetical protein
MKVYLYTKEDKERVLKLEIGAVEQEELTHATGLTPTEALSQSLEVSLTTWFAVEDDVVVGVGGITPHPEEEGIGIPWLLSTDTFVKDHLFTVNALTYGLFTYCFDNLEMYLLTNQVWSENKQSKKWLKSIGFDFMESTKWLNEQPFEQFYLYKEDYINV